MSRTKAKGGLKVKRGRTSLPPKLGMSTLMMPRMTCQSKRTPKSGLKSQRSLKSTLPTARPPRVVKNFGCMPDWSASECLDYNVCHLLQLHVLLHEDGGPCCLVRVHRQVRRCLYTLTWEESVWQGLKVQPQRITRVSPLVNNFKPVIENVQNVS